MAVATVPVIDNAGAASFAFAFGCDADFAEASAARDRIANLGVDHEGGL